MTFDCGMLSLGYVINGADKCIYCKFNNNVDIIICLYVDDLLFFVLAIMLCMMRSVFLTLNLIWKIWVRQMKFWALKSLGIKKKMHYTITITLCGEKNSKGLSILICYLSLHYMTQRCTNHGDNVK